jgi:hypothetical protein
MLRLSTYDYYCTSSTVLASESPGPLLVVVLVLVQALARPIALGDRRRRLTPLALQGPVVLANLGTGSELCVSAESVCVCPGRTTLQSDSESEVHIISTCAAAAMCSGHWQSAAPDRAIPVAGYSPLLVTAIASGTGSLSQAAGGTFTVIFRSSTTGRAGRLRIRDSTAAQFFLLSVALAGDLVPRRAGSGA